MQKVNVVQLKRDVDMLKKDIVRLQKKVASIRKNRITVEAWDPDTLTAKEKRGLRQVKKDIKNRRWDKFVSLKEVMVKDNAKR